MLNPQGKAIIFSAPSGAGKTTIVQALLERSIPLEFSISACSREARRNETDGKDYYFLGINGFKEKVDQDAFLEWEEVYPDQFYGTLASEIDRIAQNGNAVIFDVDVYGGLNLKKHLGDRALSIFIKPPSVAALKERLTYRSTETPEKIALRVSKAKEEISMQDEFDHTIINDDLTTAINQAEQTVIAFLEK
jgi:guanylate kinase